MYVAKISYQQASTAPKQATGERPERPERPEQPERPERPEVAGKGLNGQELQLKDQIRQSIIAAQDAAREAQIEARNAQREARDEANRARFEAGFPGKSGTIQIDDFPNNVIPPQVVDISIAFFVMCAVMVIGWPLARAFGRRLERSGANAAAAIPAGLGDQLQRIEQAVEAMSIEIERISESQRFLTKLQSSSRGDQPALPASERR
jgi:hypothetical protein